MAAATLPTNAGAKPFEFGGGGGGGRGGAVGAARTASPYSPFNSSASRGAATAAPPPLVSGARGSGVLLPLQLSPAIPPLCYGAADPLTSPGAGQLELTRNQAFLLLLSFDFLAPWSPLHSARRRPELQSATRTGAQVPPPSPLPRVPSTSRFPRFQGASCAPDSARLHFLPESPVSTFFLIPRSLGRSRNLPNPNGSRPHPRFGGFLLLVLEKEPPSGEPELGPRV
eukprot:XP_008759248.1 PREDICTED: uncharacterized protein LOC103691564 [Rattus norvegicus]